MQNPTIKLRTSQPRAFHLRNNQPSIQPVIQEPSNRPACRQSKSYPAIQEISSDQYVQEKPSSHPAIQLSIKETTSHSVIYGSIINPSIHPWGSQLSIQAFIRKPGIQPTSQQCNSQAAIDPAIHTTISHLAMQPLITELSSQQANHRRSI